MLSEQVKGHRKAEQPKTKGCWVIIQCVDVLEDAQTEGNL